MSGTSASARVARGRRAFMKGVGRAATTLPFYRLLEGSAAHAAPGDGTQRFIGIYVPHGVAAPLFDRRPGETETSFDLQFAGSVLAPFDDAGTFGKSWKDRITVIEGIDLAAGIESGTIGHQAAAVMLTGSAPGTAGRPMNESVDQYLAVTAGLGRHTRLSSVVLGVGTPKTDPGSNVSYGAGGVLLPKIIDPARAFDWLFGDLVASADAGGQAALERRRRRGQSVLDFLGKDIAALVPRLAAPERLKLDQHLQSLRALEQRIAAVGPGEGAVASCRPPARPDPAQFPKLEIDGGGEPYLDRITDLQIDLIAEAMACDLTRFATLFVGITEPEHSMVAHAYVAPYDGKPGDPATWAALGNVNRAYYAKCARLLQRLEAAGILDDTLVLMSSDMGDPAAHTLIDVPTVLAGGEQGRLKMGRRIVLPPNCGAGASAFCATPELSANNKLLASIVQAFGVEVSGFGATEDPRYSTGALSELA